MQQITVPFRPNLHGIFRERFYKKISIFENKTLNNEDIAEIVNREVEWVTDECNVNLGQRQIYRAAWVLLRDLLRTGWLYNINSGVLELTLPSSNCTSVSQDEIIKIKQQLRNCMEMSRLERLEESKEFIYRLESGSGTKGKIQDLIADSNELYSTLSAIAELATEQEKINVLRKKIKPYLDYVDDGIDEFTGLKKSEIWRYFRYSWSNTSESTPGRTMLYLIRDAGQKKHPVMGIASLENTALQLTKRDDFLGWTPNAYIESMDDNLESYIKKMNELITYINAGLDEINIDGLCTRKQCENPTDNVINKLKDITEKEYKNREIALKEEYIETEKSDLGGISKKAESALYLRKRADQLAQLLNAKLQITKLIKDGVLEDYKNFINSEDGKSIIRIALLTVKKVHIGSSMMELNVCGAVPPYNSILGGKLVALLMLSKEVVDQYKHKYENTPSEIASRMKGEAVVKPANLVFIGTTSLYYIGSSQYNRLSLPKELFGKFDVKWTRLGETAGYGTMHISDITTKCLYEVAERNMGYSQINHVFGEGTSPKLRLINSGVRSIMEEKIANLAANQFPKHSMPRIIYGAPIINNLQNYLFNKNCKPDYYFGDMTASEVSEKIIDYWRNRWLKMRLNNKEALENIKNFKKEEFLISNVLKRKHDAIEFISLQEASTMDTEEINKLDYIRKLYRGVSAIADKATIDELDYIHIHTDLDDAIYEAIKQGKSVVLTGNAGDGKTHIIRELEKKIKEICPNIVIALDASQMQYAEVEELWNDTVSSGNQFFIAINEAVIFNLYEFRNKKLKQVNDSYDQVVNSIYYDEQKKVCIDEVIVFDLSLRNNLDKKIVSQIIDKLTNNDVQFVCKKCPAHDYCDYIRNSKMIRNNEQVKDRLQFIFDKIARRGYHFTLREVMAYFSFILFGDRSCTELSKNSSNTEFALQNLIFGANIAEGKLFEIIEKTFDPINISVPVIDEQLVNGIYESGKWLEGYSAEKAKLEFNDYNGFCTRKRAFYFFNTNGNVIQGIVANDENEFDILFEEKKQRDALNLLINRINCFFGLYERRDKLFAWQSHRFGYNPQVVLYAKCEYGRRDFEIVLPKLCDSMKKGYELSVDHVLFRFKEDINVTLKVDYRMFELLAKAQRGIPVLYIDDDSSRRIWKFIEQLDLPLEDGDDESEVTLYDTQTGQVCKLEIDFYDKKYLRISEEKRI